MPNRDPEFNILLATGRWPPSIPKVLAHALSLAVPVCAVLIFGTQAVSQTFRPTKRASSAHAFVTRTFSAVGCSGNGIGVHFYSGDPGVLASTVPRTHWSRHTIDQPRRRQPRTACLALGTVEYSIPFILIAICIPVTLVFTNVD